MTAEYRIIEPPTRRECSGAQSLTAKTQRTPRKIKASPPGTQRTRT